MGSHREQWWAQFLEASDRFDAAYLVEGISDLVGPHIKAPLLRREVKIAADNVVRHLERPASAERALAGTLDEETVVALDKCAYAELTPIQANLARKLLSGNDALLDTAAQRLVGLGEPEAAARLREGDIGAVAFAARLSTQ